jgi:hypothetical protein
MEKPSVSGVKSSRMSKRDGETTDNNDNKLAQLVQTSKLTEYSQG